MDTIHNSTMHNAQGIAMDGGNEEVECGLKTDISGDDDKETIHNQ